MSDLVFKVPELPEDALLNKRKIVPRNRNSNKNRLAFCMESGNTSQLSLMNKSKRGSCFHLRPLRENILEDFAVPSTSKFDNNKINSFQSSTTNLGNQSAYNMSLATGSNCFLDTKMKGNDYNYILNNSNQQNISRSMFSNTLFKCDSNISSISVNCPYPVMNQNFRNSNAKCNNLYGKDQCCYFDHSKHFNTNNIEPCSSVSSKKSVFSSGLLPEGGGMRNISVNKSMNKVSADFNTYNTLNGTSVTQKDSMCPLNSSQSVFQNQAIMKSVLQTTVFSMKEQIMNTLESFGQNLLSTAPEVEELFFKVAKDVKSICENSSIFMNQTMGVTEMFLTLDCTSNRTDIHPQNMLQSQNQSHEPSKKPCNIFKEIQSKQDKVCKVKFFKTFTVEEKRLENSPEKLNLDTPSSKTVKNKEIYLRNWYPIALQGGLAFSGLNDENVEFKTGTMKKRISNRKVLLNNGYICNLIGERDPEKKFPPDISKKLRDGIVNTWRILKEEIEKFEKESQENKKITISDVSSTAYHENSFRMTRQKNRTNFVSACKENNNEPCVQPDITSMKSSNTKARSKENDPNQNKKRKIDSIKKKKGFQNDKTSCLLLKKDESFESKSTKVEHNDSDTSRVIYVTRKGRAVKRPGNLWLGENFNSTNMENESTPNSNAKTKLTLVSSEGSKEDGACHLKRKRLVSGKEAVQTKKNKSERSKNEDLQSSETGTKGRERTKKNRVDSQPSVLNSTLNSERKTSKNKERKKNKRSAQKNENADSWVNDFDDGLINISELPSEEINADIKKMKLISTETPPLKMLSSHLRILRSCTPVTQSPHWLLSQHTESGVKKFEKVRAQTFNQKIPKEKVTKSTKNSKGSYRNKDVDAVVNWISEREVKSPAKNSKVAKYVILKRRELEEEDEIEDGEDN